MPVPADYRLQADDTSFEAERIQIEAFREMPSWERASLIAEMSRSIQELALLGIGERHPGCSDEEIRLRLAALTMGRDLVREAYGWDPEKEGY